VKIHVEMSEQSSSHGKREKLRRTQTAKKKVFKRVCKTGGRRHTIHLPSKKEEEQERRLQHYFGKRGERGVGEGEIKGRGRREEKRR